MFDSLNIPSDFAVLCFLLVASLIVAIIIYIKTNSVGWGLISLSILSNVALFLNIGMSAFVIYNLLWLQYFILYVWPIINLSLIIYYFLKLRRTRNT